MAGWEGRQREVVVLVVGWKGVMYNATRLSLSQLTVELTVTSQFAVLTNICLNSQFACASSSSSLSSKTPQYSPLDDDAGSASKTILPSEERHE